MVVCDEGEERESDSTAASSTGCILDGASSSVSSSTSCTIALVGCPSENRRSP
jgi:hypothetical protein